MGLFSIKRTDGGHWAASAHLPVVCPNLDVFVARLDDALDVCVRGRCAPSDQYEAVRVGAQARQTPTAFGAGGIGERVMRKD